MEWFLFLSFFFPNIICRNIKSKYSLYLTLKKDVLQHGLLKKPFYMFIFLSISHTDVMAPDTHTFLKVLTRK